MTNDALIKEARAIDKTREHWPIIKRLADALTAANEREAKLRTELELVNDLRNRASAALEALRKEAAEAIEAAWNEGIDYYKYAWRGWGTSTARRAAQRIGGAE